MTLAAATEHATRRLLAELKDWSEQGWIRRLDRAFAVLLVDLGPASPALVILAAALLSHVEGRGHSCLRIDRILDDADAALGLAPPAADALQRVMAALPATLEGWLGALRASELVQTDDDDRGAHDSGQPLVLRGSGLYLRRYWHYERSVARQVEQRAGALLPIDLPLIRSWLDRLFQADPQPADDGFDWQKAACGLALAGGLSVITGGPGTGKTYTAARLLALLFVVDPQPQRLRIALAAPTGKAAARLSQAIGDALAPLQRELGDGLPRAALTSQIGPARTLHALLGARPDSRRFAHDAAHPLEVDVLIIDEASMIHLEMMAALFDALPAAARVILLGDKDQLASVEAGAVLGDLCSGADRGRYLPATAQLLADLTGVAVPARFVDPLGPALAQHTVMLRSSRRFGGPIGQLAAAVNRGDLAAATALLQSPPDVSLRWIAAASSAPLLRLAAGASGYRHYLAALQRRPPADSGPAAFDGWVVAVLQAFERFRVLCAVRDGEWGADGLNQAIERILLADVAAGQRSAPWYEGRPVLVTRNDAGLGVFNGDIGIALRPMTGGLADDREGAAARTRPPLRAYFTAGGGSPRSVAISRLAFVETAFAMTVHKAQGSEFDHCVLVLPRLPSRVLTRELIYTGITRSRSRFTLVTARRQALAEAVATPTMRGSGLTV